MNGVELLSLVQLQVEAQHPTILGLQWNDGAHWVAVIGVEYDDVEKYAQRLLLLDLSGPKPVACLWNGVIFTARADAIRTTIGGPAMLNPCE
jgi:hypothetical protein